MSEVVRRQILSVDSTIPVANFRSMEEIAGDSIAQYRFNMTLMTIFGAVALLLAVIGTYGVLSYQVGRRTREIGIRLALGAGRTRLLGLIIGQGLRLTALGIAIGLVATLTLSHVLVALLYGIGPRDPVTYLAITAILLAAAFLACYIPARRAAKVDPMVALRYE
jgi:putative ABC transport system permease protein